jgi:hypothetical protein
MDGNLSHQQHWPAWRIVALIVVAVTIAATVTTGWTSANNPDSRGPYAIGLWGDLPYSDVQAQVGMPNLIADMNNQKLAFTAHDGDLKAGSTECTDAVYLQALNFLNSLKGAAMFTPGDNDWTDCDRVAGYNSLAQLDKERKLFFSTQFSQGQKPMKQEVQATPLCLGVNGPTPCVENRRWSFKGVTYATLNVQGSCNNLCDVAPDPSEYAARNAANIAWLQDTFAQATAQNASAVMLITQADPGWDLSDPTRAPLRDPKTLAETDGQPDGFQEFLSTLRTEVTNFKKPVAYVNGDSHYFRIDKPFLNALGQRLENFTRVETFGDHQENGVNDMHWLKVYVDSRTREVFRYEEQIVPGNRVAVPNP